MTDTESKLRQRTDGRLDRSRDPAILNAALAALAEYGYDATNMNDIAARAGVGKAAIYRRWSSKAALITDALVYWRPPPGPPTPPTPPGGARWQWGPGATPNSLQPSAS